MSKDKTPQPMDPGAREGASPERVVRNVRSAYALDTLVSEMQAAFGEVRVTYGEPDKWQVINDATFEVTHSDMEDTLEVLFDEDSRVMEFDSTDGTVYLALRPDPRTRDSRTEFGVAVILDALNETP